MVKCSEMADENVEMKGEKCNFFFNLLSIHSLLDHRMKMPLQFWSDNGNLSFKCPTDTICLANETTVSALIDVCLISKH